MKRMLAGILLAAGASVGPEALAQSSAAMEHEPGCAWVRLHPALGNAAGGWGAADRQTGRPNDADTIFNIASVSKQFTALAVLLLAHERQVDLDAPLSRYLPQITGELGTPTLRQMLRHTSGLPDYISPLFDGGREDEVVTVAETMAVILRQPQLEFTPGSRFDYSNTGYFLLGQVVEHVSGQTLADFSRQYIFQPLGMSATTIVDHYPSGIARLARGYEKRDGHVSISESAWEQSGDGQVHTSARDMLRWLRHLDADTPLATPGGLHTAGVLTLLTEGNVPVAGKPEVSYHYGLEAVNLGNEAVWAHGGGWAGYRSFMAYAPKSHRGAAVLCNITDVDVKAVAEGLLAGELRKIKRSDP
ncbi:serine hydrolase domain-containing protein [Pusillimonas sp. SM2304]|uniref:serine hydrolase domain-containing protein n=1 Tax=Pusillimonas sp. SM2304 TaxID=3073241 RepID=UPI0028759367|nr:serine hydrolase domain-containing protein [Pusillimonas sp. SM2304]MDS1139474.1 serine hydrolase domain-containing protein [Pusillimonas sp. SM2304]